VNILLWHVHGSWTTAFVQGKHRYLVPVNEARDTWGRGRARTFDWPPTVEEMPLDRITDVDVAIVQRPEELDLVPRGVPVVYVEHNTPKGDVPNSRHPMADRDDLVVVHVTHFNELFWDTGGTRSRVIEHGIVEPEPRWSGGLPRFAVVTNEPVRRRRVTGTDLYPRFARVAPLDVFGMGLGGLRGDRIETYEDPPQREMHRMVAQRQVYLHLCRWTSLGLSLIEAMQMGMPVVGLATTEAAGIPPDAGIFDTRVDTLVDATHWLLEDPSAARRLGSRAREVALTRYGLDRFLADWARLLEEETCGSR
jgi:glycosyltransferase involved in cell wall biosynthesis